MLLKSVNILCRCETVNVTKKVGLLLQKGIQSHPIFARCCLATCYGQSKELAKRITRNDHFSRVQQSHFQNLNHENQILFSLDSECMFGPNWNEFPKTIPEHPTNQAATKIQLGVAEIFSQNIMAHSYGTRQCEFKKRRRRKKIIQSRRDYTLTSHSSTVLSVHFIL